MFLSYFKYVFTRAERAHDYIWCNAGKDTQEAVYLAFYNDNKWDEYFQFLLDFYNTYEPDSQRKAMLGRLACKDIDNAVMEKLTALQSKRRRLS